MDKCVVCRGCGKLSQPLDEMLDDEMAKLVAEYAVCDECRPAKPELQLTPSKRHIIAELARLAVKLQNAESSREADRLIPEFFTFEESDLLALAELMDHPK